jgi:hypothetical protein
VQACHHRLAELVATAIQVPQQQQVQLAGVRQYQDGLYPAALLVPVGVLKDPAAADAARYLMPAMSPAVRLDQLLQLQVQNALARGVLAQLIQLLTLLASQGVFWNRRLQMWLLQR